MSDGEAATRRSWKIQPMSDHRRRIDYQRAFSEAEFAKISSGHIPRGMEDKWFAFFEDGWVHFHRSWTGFCIFQLKLAKTAEGWRVEEAWVTEEDSQYRSRGDAGDVALLKNVMGWVFGI